jgi:acetyl esterase/lipase
MIWRTVTNLGGEKNMALFTRRRFVQASGLLAATPALAALTARAQPPAPPPPPDIGKLRAEKDIVFGKGGDIDLTLDVYHPPVGVTPKRMAIIHLFGGGFFAGNKGAGYIINDAKALGNYGYTSVSSNYRLQTQGKWPAQLHDVKAAIRWTRANAAKLGVDTDKIAVAGYSAGGMLALMAAGTNGKPEFDGSIGTTGVSSDVNACIGVYPLASAQIAGGLFPEGQATPENIAAASPTTYISSSFAPTIFVHGTADTTVPLTSSLDFFNKLTAAGVPTALTAIQGAQHAFDNAALDAVELMARSIDLFLDRLIVNPKPYPSFGGGGGRRPGGGGPGGGGGGGGAGGPGGGGGGAPNAPQGGQAPRN